MEPHPAVPDRRPAEPEEAFARAQARLGDARTALARATGGAPPRAVLAELAQQLAAELATHFDELPMHRFTGRVARVPGVLGAVLPGRRVPHRVLLGRYLATGLAAKSSGGSRWSVATIAVLGLGADGVLRLGRLNETVHRPEDEDPFGGPVAWDDRLMRGVPSRTLWVSRWEGGDAAQVASPAEVLDALATLAGSVASASLRDLALLQRLLRAPDTG
jgi:hypothetical protein